VTDKDLLYKLDIVDERGLVSLEATQSYPHGISGIADVAWSSGGSFLAACGEGSVVAWPAADPGAPRVLKTASLGRPVSVAWRPDHPTLAIAFAQGTVATWGINTGFARALAAASGETTGVAWSADGSRLAVTDAEGGLGIWDATRTNKISYSQTHGGGAGRPCWSPDGRSVVTYGGDGVAVSGAGFDGGLSRWILRSGSLTVTDIALSPEGDRIAVGTSDRSVRIFAMHGAEIAVLEGGLVQAARLRFSPDGEFLAVVSRPEIVLWRCRDWEQVARINQEGSTWSGGIDFHPSRRLLAAAEDSAANQVRCYTLDYQRLTSVAIQKYSRRYVNAKVVLLGDTGVGKSGLGLVLSGQPYRATDSTHGRNVWTFASFEFEQPGSIAQTREVLLWDLAGQPGYRLVHQLHLNEAAVALIVFDSRSETDPFSGVKYWVRALAQARLLEGQAAVPLRTYLVAARADRGGVAVTPARIQGILDDFGLDGFFETSAKEGWGIRELTQAINDGISWQSLPTVSSNTLFDSIKTFLLEEKEQGRLLSTSSDLFHAYRRTQQSAAGQGQLSANFNACIGRVSSRGLITRLHFGDLILLQPELLDSYASAMIQAAKEEPDGLGFIPEEEALEGRFRLAPGERIQDRAQEKLLLIATVEELLRHEIALKEATDRGVDLIFPSQFTRERSNTPDIQGKEVVFTFDGPLRNIYARLAVRLSHSKLFSRQEMWQNTASYSAIDGGTCGMQLRELEEGHGELALFYDRKASPVVRAQFETYIRSDLRLRAIPGSVTSRRAQICPDCGYALPDDLIRRRLETGNLSMRCPACDQSIMQLVQTEPPAVVDTAVGGDEPQRRPTPGPERRGRPAARQDPGRRLRCIHLLQLPESGSGHRDRTAPEGTRHPSLA
jgi:WD40 repeat protein